MKNNLEIVQAGYLVAFLFFCSPLFSQKSDNLYATAKTENVVILEPTFTSSKTNLNFEKKYHYLIARAYFRLLSEAEKSERKLRIQSERYSFENEKFDREDSSTFQNKLNLFAKKYRAHNAMLSGLKSWNLFSEYRTGDMFYFMAENEDRIFQMYKGNLSEDKIVKYLIYKLADLYHLEEQS